MVTASELMECARCVLDDRWECIECGEYFDTGRAFRFHRAEDLRKLEVTECRCMTPHEMRQRGMWQSDAGFWRVHKRTYLPRLIFKGDEA